MKGKRRTFHMVPEMRNREALASRGNPTIRAPVHNPNEMKLRTQSGRTDEPVHTYLPRTRPPNQGSAPQRPNKAHSKLFDIWNSERINEAPTSEAEGCGMRDR